MENCESTQKDRDINKELDGYKRNQSIITANRDGDLFYIECPTCQSTELTWQRIIGCSKCHERFAVYFEDGFKIIDVEGDSIGQMNGYSNDKEIKIIKILQFEDGTNKVLLPRNDYPEVLKNIKGKFKIKTLYRDFNPQTGKDGHGHVHYKRYALIPLDDFKTTR